MKYEKIDEGRYEIYGPKQQAWIEKIKSIAGGALLLALVYAFITR